MKYVAYGMQLLYGMRYIICNRNVETVIHEGLQYETSFIEYEKASTMDILLIIKQSCW